MSAGPALRSANLNLIPVLRALLQHGNVSRAANTLGLSQSATSSALARLRLLLDDPVMVQVGRTMQLTPKARALIVPLEQLCRGLEDLLKTSQFDPGSAERTFVVATPDYVGLLIGMALTKALERAAPRVGVHFVDVPANLPGALASGEVDIGIVALERPAWAGLSSARVFSDRMVGMVRKGHPLAGRAVLTSAEVATYPQLQFHAGLGLGGVPATAAGGQVRLMAQQFTVLPLLALESDSVAVAPKMLADRMAGLLPLARFDLPYPTIAIEGGLLWSPVQDADPAHRWFRDLTIDILRAAAEVTEDAAPSPG